MAPSATATATATVAPPANASLKLYADGQGDYKDLSSVAYEKDTEVKGGNGFEAAKVSASSPPFALGDMLLTLVAMTDIHGYRAVSSLPPHLEP